ncbi:MAG: leucine-rich repeat protein [Treponema sp.]|jgi:hypothetical protein|nr:leucine-rich repeat protein [Treponema sp.]
MKEFIDFIGKFKIKNIILFCIFVLPYIFWIIWFIGKNILTLTALIAKKISENKREIKVFAGKMKHYVWSFYKNIYIALLVPFIIFCVKWNNFDKYVSEIIIVAGLISIPIIIYLASMIRRVFLNLLEGITGKSNVYAGNMGKYPHMRRSSRKVWANILTLLMMPIFGLLIVLLIIFSPFIIAGIYVEWIKQFVQMLKQGNNVKHAKGKQKKQLILYKYMPSDGYFSTEHKDSKRKNYIEGKLYFSNREELNDPAENIPLINHTVSRTSEELSASKRNDDGIDPLDLFKICSMTSNPNNFVMWANYAKNHTGICIEIAIDTDILNEDEEKIICEKVIYAKSLPVIKDFVYPYDLEKDDITWDDIRKLIFYKLDHWKCEDEWRLVKITNKSDMWRIGKVTRILCGYKCTSDYVEKLKKEVPVPVEQITYERSDINGVNLYVPGSDPDAYGSFSNDEWEYHVGDEGIKILAYIGKKHDIEIPVAIRGKPVITIGEHAFRERIYLGSVTIPDGVSCIEAFAFYNCFMLSTIFFGKGVKTIGKEAFALCYSLTSVVLPENISYIGKGAFRGCYQLSTVTMPENVKCGSGAFAGCSSQMSLQKSFSPV